MPKPSEPLLTAEIAANAVYQLAHMENGRDLPLKFRQALGAIASGAAVVVPAPAGEPVGIVQRVSVNGIPLADTSSVEWLRPVEAGTKLYAAAPPAEQTEDARDAARGRWLLQYLLVAADGPNEWTCWLDLRCVPFRSDPKAPDAGDPTALLDKLMERSPVPPRAEPGEGESKP